MKKTCKCLIFLLSLTVILLTPLSVYAANIPWADGEDDCDHDYEVVGYDSETSSLTLVCAYCGDSYTETVNDFYSVMTFENETDNCTHNYQITAFDKNTATAVVVCSYCGDRFDDDFAAHVYDGVDNSNYVKWFDVVDDGYINGKDFAALFVRFSDDNEQTVNIRAGLNSFFNQSDFSYKEIFFYCYFTVLIVLLFVITFIIKRKLI